MDGVLKFLTTADANLLRNKAQLARVQPGHFLIREGKPPVGMFVIRSGKVSVQRDLHGHAITITELGPGTVLGETAMLRPSNASASVVAIEETDAYVFTPERMAPIFEADPGLFGRFFQSLARVISRRLRDTTELTGGDPFTEKFGKIPEWELI